MPDIIPAGTTVELPYHFNENGEPIKVQISQDTTSGELQSFLNQQFPRDAAAVARQMATPGSNPVTPDEFKEVKDMADAQATIAKDRKGTGGVMPFLARLGDVGKHAIKDVVDGAAEVATQSMAGTHLFAQGRYEEGLKQSAYGLAKILEGTVRGGERMADLAKLATSFLYTGDEALANGYDTYLQLKQNEANDTARASGQTILFGKDKEMADSANKISNVLDPSIVLPLVGKAVGGLSKAGELAAADAIKQMVQESSASYLRQMAGAGIENVGKITSAVGSMASPLSEGVKVGLRYGGGAAAAYELDQGNFGLAAGLGLLAGGPFALRAVGAMAQGAGKTLAMDSASLAGREILAQSGKAATEDAAIRLAMAIKPPDSVARFVGSAIDSSLNGAAIGAGGSYLEAMADPFNSGADVAQATALGAYGGGLTGLTFHAMHGGGMSEFSKETRDANYTRNIAHDIMSRPEERSVIIDGKEITTNDRENRINLLVNSDISTGDKARISSVLRSAEAAGHNVIFVNDSTELPDALGGNGAAMGKGVSVRIGEDGRSTIVINSDKITAPSAIEEVSHALIGDQMARSVLEQISKEKGGLKQALDSLAPFGETYAAIQSQTNPAAGKAFRDSLEIAKNPNIPENIRIQAALPLMHEYLAMGAGEVLKGKAPTELETGLSGNIWQKASETVLSGIGMTPSGASIDPITGFFWKDGKIINDPVTQNIAKNVQKVINTGKPIEAKAKPQAGVAPVAVPVHPTGYQAGDIALDGSKITGFSVGPRYEDVLVDSKTGVSRPTTGAEKDTLHKFVFDQVSKIKGNQIVEQGNYEDGVYAGPIKPAKDGKPSKPIVYIDSPLSQADLLKLYSVTDHRGNLVIDPSKRQAVELANASIGTGNILNMDVNVNLNKSKESNREYAARVGKTVLALGLQMHPNSGPLLVTYDLSLLDNILNHERQLTPRVDAALKDFGITNLQDAVPYIKGYLENLSNSKSLPSAERLALMAPEGAKPESAAILRDVFHLSGGLSQRKGTDERLTNEPFQPSITKLPPYSVDVGGVTKTLARDQSVFNWHRLDDLNGASLYQPDGTPISIAVNKGNMVSRYRANFSPDTSPVENLGDRKVITDPIAKERIIVNPNGKATLFLEGDRKVVFASEQEAIDYSNKGLAKSRARFSPSSREDMPEGPVFTKEQAQQRIGSAADWEVVSMLKDRDKNQKRIERTYNRILTSDKSSKRVEALNNAVDVIQENAGIKIDKNKFPFYGEDGRAPALYREMQQSISKAYPELTDLFKLGELEHQVQGKKSFGISLDLFPTIEGRETSSMKIGREMSELTDKIVQKFEGKISNADALKKSTQVYDSITNVFSKTERDLAADKINNEFIALVDATRPSSGGQNVRFSPDTEGYQRYTPEEKKRLQQHILYSDIRNGTAFKELRAAHDAMLRGRQEESGGALPTWVEAKELRTDIDRKAQSKMRARRRMAQTIREESAAWQAEDRPPVYDPESFAPRTGKKPRSERTQMSQAELEAVTEASGYKPPVGKSAEVRPSQVVKPGTTLKSLQDLTGLQTYAPSPKAEVVVTAQTSPTTRPNVTDLISQKTKPFRAVAIKTEAVQGFLKELAGSKAGMYEAALKQAGVSEPSTYTLPNKKAPEQKSAPPVDTKVEGVATALDDSQIPKTHVIQFTQSGKFKVWSIGRQAVDAVSDSYQDALMRAKKKASQERLKKPKTRIVAID